MDTEKIWKEVLASVRVSISSANFSTWLSKTFIYSTKTLGEDRQFVEIGCPSPFIADSIEKRYFGLLQDSLNQITGLTNDLSFLVKQKPGLKKNETLLEPLFTNPVPSEEVFSNTLKYARVRPGFTFENFAVSGTNQMAWAAAEAVSENLGHAYNPLFLWGGVGVGKTHLMLAVADRALRKNPDFPILYCMGEEFTTEIVDAIRTKNTIAFKNKYRKLKLLMIDDIQFLAGKNAVQEEFFHTFNTLQREGGQIILTSDKPPSEIEKLEERLRSRFEAGLIVDISPPDFELRTAITLIKAQERGFELPMEIAQAIAANIDAARKIEGFITRLFTHTQFAHEEITIEVVHKLLGTSEQQNSGFKKHTSPQDFINAVATYYSIGKRRLLGTNRAQTVALPRQVLMYLLRIELRLPLQEVGRIVGGKDHTTVIHAVEKISKNLSVNGGLRDDLLGIKKTLSV
ncbi:MAG: chromosomal replication initiator protein DnaA [Candidatus Blackburnbacteria bacterium]|nr:chromosomal replication initiator protein DnaA [Candidatus Blackburnbacteria bacterium]